MTAITITRFPVSVKPANQAGWWTPTAVDMLGNEYFAACCVANTGSSGRHNVAVVKNDTNSIVSVGYCVERDSTLATYIDDFGHNCPSIAVDIDGYIHVATSMHVSTWHYFKSKYPYDINSLVEQSIDLPDLGFQYTYPILTADAGGNVYIMARGGTTTNNFDRAGLLYKYSRATGLWERQLIIANEGDRSFYPDDLRVNDDLSANILWERGPSGSGTLRHEPAWVSIDKLGNLSAPDGTVLHTPIDVGNGGAHCYQPLVAGESYAANDTPEVVTSPGVQTAKFVYDNGVVKNILYRYRPLRPSASSTFGGFDVKLATYVSGTGWTYETILSLDSSTISTSAALSATVWGSETRLYFSIEKVSSSITSAQLVMARPKSGGGWEFVTIGPSYKAPLRMMAIKETTGDMLYVTAPNEGKLMRYFVPLDLTDSNVYATQELLIASL